MSIAGSRRCPSCGTTHDINDTFCGKCGRPVRGHEEALPTIATFPHAQRTLSTSNISDASQSTFYEPPQHPFIPTASIPPSPRKSVQKSRLLIAGFIVLLLGLIALELGQFLRGNMQGTIGQVLNLTKNNASGTGVVLYQEDGTDYWKGWTGSPDWKVLNNKLLNDGTFDGVSPSPTIPPPYRVTATGDYAIEATMQLQHWDTNANYKYIPYFAITLRQTPGDSTTGYSFVLANGTPDGAHQPVMYIEDSKPDFASSILAKALFTPGYGVHTYRIEAKGNSIKVLVDGSIQMTTTDNQFLTGGGIGLTDGDAQLTVTSFKVIAL